MLRFHFVLAGVVFALSSAQVVADEIKPIAVFKGHDNPIRFVGIAADKTVLSIDGSKEIRRWSQTKKDLPALESKDSILFHQRACLINDGKLLARLVGCQVDDRTCFQLQILELATGKLVAGGNLIDPTRDLKSGCDHFALAPDRTMAAGVLIHPGSFEIKFLDLETKKVVAGPDVSSFENANPISVTYTPDGKHLITGHSNGAVAIWKTSTAKMDRQFKTNGEPPSADHLVISPDGKRVAIAGFSSKNVKVFEFASGEEKFALQHDEEVRCVEYSKDGKLLATGGHDHLIRIWDSAEGKLLATIEAHIRPINCLAWSYDGKSLASGSDDLTVKLWDVAAILERKK